MDLPDVVILRGAQGAGKSTFARELATKVQCVIVSTDDYFTKDGVYTFDASALSKAHSVTFREYVEHVQQIARYAGDDAPIIVVDNTNAEAWQIAPYVMIASAYDLTHAIVTLAGRHPDIHGAPAGVVERTRLTVARAVIPRQWRRATAAELLASADALPA